MMPFVLSEPALPNTSSKEAQVMLNRTTKELDPLVLEAKNQVEKDPKNPELWVKYGRALRRQAMHREAIEAYSLGLTYNPFHPLLYRHKGHTYINIGEYAMSAAIFELALRIDPSDWDCWYHQAVAYYLNKNYELAIKSMTKALEIAEEANDFDDIVSCKDWMWLSYTHLGKMEEAAAIVADVELGGNTTYSTSYYHRVLCYNKTYTPEEVVAIAEKLDDHMYATYTYGISWFYMVDGEKDKAYAILKNIVDKTPSAWGGFAEHAGRRDFYEWED